MNKDRETERLEREVKQLRQEVSDMKRLLGALMSMIMEEDVDMSFPSPFMDTDDDYFSRPN